MPISQGIPTRAVPSGNGVAQALRLTKQLSLAIAQMEAPYLESTRSGRRFGGGTTIIANGIAPVAAIPTTAATLALYNNDTGNNGLSLVIDWLSVALGSGTPAAGKAIYAAVFRPTTAPTANATGYGSQSLSGSSRTSKGIWATAQTAPAGVNWSCISADFQLAAANVGQGDNFADLGGRIVVPPGQCLGLAILSGAGTTPLYAVSAQWSELELDLE